MDFGPAWADGLVLGHELSAVMHGVGSELDGWAPGDRVAVDPRIYCSECPSCRGGLMTLCERGAQWLGVADGRDGGAANVVVLDPAERRTRAALERGATAGLDPSVRGVTRAVREVMPRGADVVFACMEDYVPAAGDYLRLAARMARVQGTVVVLRAYGAAPYARIDPQVPYMKELTVRHFGAFFGEEPIRGGRARGDWQVALEALDDGGATGVPDTAVVDFEDLTDGPAVDAMLALLPEGATKVLVEIGGG